MTYYADTIFFAQNDEIINDMISGLQNDFDLTDEGDVEAFLRIKFKQNNHKSTMLQPGLIDSILNKVNILNQEKVKMYDTPVTALLLHKHINGEPLKEDWDYRSIIG